MESPHPTAPKALVACFSASGVTAALAATLARLTGAGRHAITPAQPYSEADLDWRNPRSRSSVEMADAAARPALQGAAPDVAACSVLFIGYPIWWDEAPRAVNTFLESLDLRGKRLIPFATSGSSGIDNSVAVLRRSYPGLDWQPGRLLNGAGEGELRAWLSTHPL